MAKKRGSTASYTVILIFTTALAKALGFGREMSLAYVYGASPVSDAYIVAFSIPTIIFAGIGSAMLTSSISRRAAAVLPLGRGLPLSNNTIIADAPFRCYLPSYCENPGLRREKQNFPEPIFHGRCRYRFSLTYSPTRFSIKVIVSSILLSPAR